MERHLFTFAFLLFISSNLFAQSIHLENGWKIDSKYVYVAVNNRLLVRGQVKAINSVRCENAWCKIVGDTVFVNPTVPGPLEIELYTDQQKHSFNYIVKMLEPPSVSVNAPSNHGLFLSKSDIDKATLDVSSWKPVEEGLYENFVLDGFVMKVTGEKYYVKGIYFSEEVRAALNKLGSGDSFSVEEVHLKNKENGLPFRNAMSVKFKIL